MKEQIDVWKRHIAAYKDAYAGLYSKQPSEKLVESFCKINSIPWPLPAQEEEYDFLL